MQGVGVRSLVQGTKILHATQHGQKKFFFNEKEVMGNSLAVEWLRLSTFTLKGPGSSPGQGTKISLGVQHSPKKKLPSGCG